MERYVLKKIRLLCNLVLSALVCCTTMLYKDIITYSEPVQSSKETGTLIEEGRALRIKEVDGRKIEDSPNYETRYRLLPGEHTIRVEGNIWKGHVTRGAFGKLYYAEAKPGSQGSHENPVELGIMGSWLLKCTIQAGHKYKFYYEIGKWLEGGDFVNKYEITTLYIIDSTKWSTMAKVSETIEAKNEYYNRGKS